MKHWLAALADNKLGPDEESIGTLEAYCRDNPYCQAAHMLLAIALSKHGRDPEGHHLNRALAYAIDRQLFKFRMKQMMATTPPAEEGVQLAGSGYELEPDVPTPYLEQIELEGKEVKENPDEQVADNQELSSKQQKQQALIDRFLQSDARIIPHKEGHVPDDSGLEQADEEPGVLSETLAEIFARQGKTDKALGIYEKLCLKYPEKSSYFAKKIENLQNKAD